MKSILLPLTYCVDAESLSRVAADLTKRFHASLHGLFIRPDPRMAIPFMGEGLTADMIQQLCDSAEKEGLANAEKAEKDFLALMQASNIKIIKKGEHSDHARARWSTVTGQITDHVGRRARTADLAICAQPSSDMPDSDDIFHDLIFRSGRSVLMVPAGYDREVGRHVMIAWNGRAEGARAVAGAMPMLIGAEKVTVVQIGDKDDARPGLEDVIDYLGEYGIEARARQENVEDNSIGNQLLSLASDMSADTVVLGAYSHSRWRELVLGGVTRHIVAKSKLPIFMSH
ncbi:universal stress protein [Kordiimonas sp.]|uniref:universal stress protein n=1 Tax=Kordiimonas sp. TaxID=1970157 RepID=UPI003A90AD62